MPSWRRSRPAWCGLGCSIRSAPAQADQVLGPGLGRPFARSWRPALTPFRLTRRVNQRDASQSPYVTQQRNRAPGGIAREPFTVEVLRFARYEPTGVELSAVLPALTDRCGIYVLHFDDGHRYVGQARDVLVRFSDHRRRWGDRIVALEFGAASAPDLNDLERRTIQQLEHQGSGCTTAPQAGLPMGESPLDLVVDRVEQERWLDSRPRPATRGRLVCRRGRSADA